MSSPASALKLENIVCARPSRPRVTIQPCVESFSRVLVRKHLLRAPTSRRVPIRKP
jgi:hypothetical protein